MGSMVVILRMKKVPTITVMFKKREIFAQGKNMQGRLKNKTRNFEPYSKISEKADIVFKL